MEKFVPKVGEQYWFVDFMNDSGVGCLSWDGYYTDKIILNTCGCYRTREEAIAKAKEMLGIYEIGGVEYRRGEMVEVKDLAFSVWHKQEFFGYMNNSILCKKEFPCVGLHNWEQIRKLTPQPPLVGKTVEFKVDGKTYVAEIKEEK